MSHNHFAQSPSASSSAVSTPLHAYAPDPFFLPQYPPNDIEAWRSDCGNLDSSCLAGSLGPNPTPSLIPFNPSTTPHPRTNPKMSRHLTTSHRPKGSSKLSPSPARRAADPETEAKPGPSKRARMETPSSAGRISGACTRCKKLKMKCTFTDDSSSCARCIVGDHECVVLGRKPRSPGMRDILRKQIREKDIMIDNLLNRLNPAAPMATPLSLNPSRLALTPSQRVSYRDVLAYLERVQNVGPGRGEPKVKIDISSFDEDDSDYDSEGEDKMSQDETTGSTYQINPIPPTFTPTGFVAKAVLESKSRISSPTTSPDTSVTSVPLDGLSTESGIGNLEFFEPGPSANLELRRLIVERQAAPDIILSGLVTCEDIPKLFEIYWKWIHPVMPILDENIHTPAAILGRCPFLFTIICAVSSRYYEEKPDMYTMAIHMAKSAAANAFLDGWKTIEMCQAFAILSAYMPPARKWDEDRTWFFSGVAFRLAIDLDLSQPSPVKPKDERSEREMLNRRRTFLILYIMDRAFCINLGKPFMMPENDLVRGVYSTFLSSKYQCSRDAYIACLVDLYQIMTRFAKLANPALQSSPEQCKGTDLAVAQKVIDEELSAWSARAALHSGAYEKSKEPEDRLTMALLYSCFQHCRLVTFSAGLQQIVKDGKLQEDNVFFVGCLDAGSALVNIVVDRLLPTGFVRYSPEHVFALSAFGSAVLMKCLRPEYASKLDTLQQSRIITLLKHLLRSLNTDLKNVTNDPTPRHCYAKFLDQLLGSRMVEMRSREQDSLSFGALMEGIKTEPVVDAVLEEQPQETSSASSTAALPDLQAPLDMNAGLEGWDSVLVNQDPDTIALLLGFSESDCLSSIMAFPEQNWFM